MLKAENHPKTPKVNEEQEVSEESVYEEAMQSLPNEGFVVNLVEDEEKKTEKVKLRNELTL